MRIPAKRSWRSEQGSAMVEFALVAVMFVVLLLGVVEMCRMFLVYTALSHAARAGTRYAIVHGSDRTGTGVDGPSGSGNTTQVETVVKNFAGASMLDINLLTVTVSYPSGNSVGNKVDVTVTYPYDAFVPYFSTLLAQTFGAKSEGVIVF